MMDDLTGGGSSERATGTPNTIYDLSSVLFHALEGGASYDMYIEDAEREGDEELVDYFTRVRDEDSMRADEAQRLLAERSPTTTSTSTTAEPVEGATAPSEGLAASAPRREETATGRVEGRSDMDAAATGLGTGAGRVEPDVPPRTEEAPPPRTSGIEEGAVPRREEDAPLGREDDREPQREQVEDKGLLDRARDAILGEEEEPRRREGTDRLDREDRPSGR